MKSTSRLLFLAFAIQALVINLAAAKLSQTETEALSKAAEKIYTATKERDWKTVVDSTHPIIAKDGGGMEKIAEATKKAFASFDSIGIRFEKHSLGKPGRLYQLKVGQLCFLPKESVIAVRGRRVASKSYMICVREKPGAKWLFIEGSGMRRKPNRLWDLFPDLPKSVKLPSNTQKVIE